MRRNIFVWALYDFANSIVMIAFLFYFSQWLVVDSGKPDWWYNATLVVSSVLFIITAPILGQRLDITARKLSGVRITTVLTIAAYLSTALVTLFFPQLVLLATILFTFALYFYILSFVYYTPMINDLATFTNKGFVSGIGMGANYLGQVLGILAVLPFATGTLYLFGAPGRAQALLPAVILFALFSLPMLLAYRENIVPVVQKMRIGDEYQKILQTFKQIISIRNLSLLIIGYFFFSDALLTFSNNFPIYLEKVYAASDTVKTYLTAAILTFSGIGSVIIGRLADKTGHKRTLLAMLVCWAVLFVLFAYAPSFNFVIGVTLVGGILFGPMWGVSRAMVGDLAPKAIEASSFSIYTVAERFATFVGPLTWSAVLAGTSAQGNMSYNYAVLSMSALILMGTFFVMRIKAIPTEVGSRGNARI